MLEVALYAVMIIVGVALGAVIAAFVGGFLAFWIWLIAANGWHVAKMLVEE